MEKLLAVHAQILKDIQLVIEQNYRIKAEHIRPVNFSIDDGSSMSFQLSFDYPSQNPVQNVLLTFELKENSPQTLYFDALVGSKGYEKSNNYHGLEGEIIKYVDNCLGD